MLIGLALQFFFGLLITILFCAAAAIAAQRAPRHLPWLSLVAASRCFVTMAGGISLVYLSKSQGRTMTSGFSSLMSAQAVLSGLSNLLLFAGALSLLLFLLSEREHLPRTDQPQNC